MIGGGAGVIGAKENKSSDFQFWRLAALLDLHMKQQLLTFGSLS